MGHRSHGERRDCGFCLITRHLGALDRLPRRVLGTAKKTRPNRFRVFRAADDQPALAVQITSLISVPDLSAEPTLARKAGG
ncbi:hypothetical protein NONI108955_18250 [Nocardia ninae]